MNHTERLAWGAWGARSRVCGSARSPERTAERPGAQAKHGRPGVAGRERAGARMMLGRAHCRPGTAASEHIAVRAWVAYASGWASIPIPVFELWLETLALQWIPILHIGKYPQKYPQISAMALYHIGTAPDRLRRRRADHAAALTR